jgi:hypothetical protein
VSSDGSVETDINSVLFFEETDYRVQAQSKLSDVDVSIWHRDKRVIRNIETIAGTKPSTAIGTVRFKQSIGLSTFVVVVGDRQVSATIEIFPIKLDYQADYEVMLNSVRDVDRLLSLRYFEDTFRSASLDDVADQQSLDWLAILRYQIEDLDKSLRYAESHPLDSLTASIGDLRADRIRRPDSLTRNAIRRRQGQGAVYEIDGIGAIRSNLPVPQITDTYDSAEHRWLARQLAVVARELRRLSDELAETARKLAVRAPLKSTATILQEISEIHSFELIVQGLQRLRIFQQSVNLDVPTNFTSLRLLSTSGYSQAYQSLMSLRMGLEALDGSVEISISRLGALYEVWCFVEVVRQLHEVADVIVMDQIGELLKETTLGRQLVKGRKLQLRFGLKDGRTVEVRYNSSYPGLTGTQYPDIVVSFLKDGWPELVVLLDAKYRLNLDDEAKKQFKIVPPPQDAIDALHRYRDAIVIRDPRAPIYVLKEPMPVLRPVVKGAALYPLPAAESHDYENSTLALAMSELGIGALPFLPGNTDIFKLWFTDLLNLSHAELGRHGPAFVGAEFRESNATKAV